MTAALTDLTLAEARDGLQAGSFSSVELTRAHSAAVARARPLNAFITETPDLALGLAEASDARRKRDGAAGPMDGIPIAVKDLFCTGGVLTTAGSHILDGFTPTYDSTVTANLKRAGAVMLGKTNMDEFAMGSANMTSYYGPVKNPWKGGDGRDLVPGGSSGGSTAAVAARLCLGAIGTDTGGSIRQPASFCGVVGLKPTYGRCSRWGIVAFASSLDQAGPMARTVRDAAIVLGAMAGHDARDSTSAPVDVPDFEAGLDAGVGGLRVGIPKEYVVDGMAAEIGRLWEKGAAWLKESGADIVEVSLPHTRYALPAYYIVAPAEASSNLARFVVGHVYGGGVGVRWVGAGLGAEQVGGVALGGGVGPGVV
ncbi:MAG: amidase, partial [Alphaproteobacteria bacterium]|nr:amidase [Alphaproteobacteria bacterium]